MSEPTTTAPEEAQAEALERGWERPSVLVGLDLGRHAIIEASAGTGKTYTLEHLVLELVAGGAPIEQILVVTFTDKAAREMRARIRARLLDAHARARRAGASLASRLATAAAGFDRAPISTIHSFCQRALAEHAFVSGRAFTFERIDGRESFGHAVRETLRSGLARNAPERGALRSALTSARASGADGALARLESLLFAWSREPGEVRPRFEPVPAARALLSLPSGAELLEPRWREVIASLPSPTARARVRDALIELAAAVEPHRAELASKLERGEDPADAEVWGPALAWAASATDPRGTEGNVSLCAAQLGQTSLPEAGPAGAPDVGAVFRVLHRALGSPVPFLLHAVLPRVQARWERQKSERSAVDFDDMLTALERALEADAAVRGALRARYRHALVDEFQDTDAVQWGIFRRLFVETEEAAEHAPSSEGDVPRRTLVVIGDVKQAIYGFRSADVHTFAQACRDLESAGGQRARLAESFRSSEAMLAGLDRILGARDGEEPFFTGVARYDTRLSCGVPSRRALAPDGSEAPAIVVQHLVGAPELRLPLIRRAHAEAIAKEIVALVEGGITLVEDPETSRAVRYEDVFILTRSSKEGRDVAEALRRHGVPHAFFKQDGLFRTAEARDFLDALRAVASPRDRSLRARALLGPFFGVPLAELATAATIGSDHPVARRLAHWASLADAGRTPALLTAMIDESGLGRRELYLRQSERALVNFRHLAELLLELATGRRLHVSELVVALSERIELAEAGASHDEDIQRLESERDAVQILTMHKAKGLEAEVVFVFGGLGKPPKRRLTPRVTHEDDGSGRPRRIAWACPEDALEPPEIRRRLAGEAREEDERLYYVAMTRAKRRLYLPYFGTPPGPGPLRSDVTYDPPHFKGAYRVVNERLEQLAASGELVVAPFEVRTIEVGARMRARAPAVELPSPEVHALAPTPRAAAAELSRMTSAYLGAEITSYTRMKALARHARGVGEGPGWGAVAGSPALAGLPGEPVEGPCDDGPGGASFGVLVHGLLEDWLRAHIELAEPLDVPSLTQHPLVEARLAAHGASAEERELSVTLFARALATPIVHPAIQLPGGFGSVGQRAVELPFLFPVPERDHPPLGTMSGGTTSGGTTSGGTTSGGTMSGGSSGGFRVARGFVRGVIDLLFEHEGKLFVLDWKTDRLESYAPAALGAHVEADYRVQAALYTLAALRAMGAAQPPGAGLPELHARFGGLLYVFVRGLGIGPAGEMLGVHVSRPALEEVRAWETMARETDGLFDAPLPARRAPLAPPPAWEPGDER